MSVHFSESRFETVRKNYGLWWERKLPRPIARLTVENAYQRSEKLPKAPLLSQANCHDFSYTPDELIEAIDYQLSGQEYMGDAFPFVNFSVFGPGVLAAFCGAKLDNSSSRVWFFPETLLPIDQIHIRYDPQNKWALRIKELYRAGQRRWGSSVLLGMPDLGGVLDVVASFRESENLLMDLYDAPEEVLRLCEEAHAAWLDAYRDLNAVLQPINPGYSDWSMIYSQTPSYILQSDFSYMIGTPMFDRFTLPFLKASCENIDHTIYHLDGVGELPHLDHILEIPKLDAVQWVHGDGQPSNIHWLDVYRKIEAAGKGIYLTDDYEEVARVIQSNLYMPVGAATVEEGRAFLARLGVPDYGV